MIGQCGIFTIPQRIDCVGAGATLEDRPIGADPSNQKPSLLGFDPHRKRPQQTHRADSIDHSAHSLTSIIFQSIFVRNNNNPSSSRRKKCRQTVRNGTVPPTTGADVLASSVAVSASPSSPSSSSSSSSSSLVFHNTF
uniref:Uncharacterized protein n=1 Tax=Anopheles melas TaxID=34690 RepID=A0A182TJ24_9DIPT